MPRLSSFNWEDRTRDFTKVMFSKQNITVSDWTEYYHQVIEWCESNVANDWFITPNDTTFEFGTYAYSYIGGIVSFKNKEDAATFILFFGVGGYRHF